MLEGVIAALRSTRDKLRRMAETSSRLDAERLRAHAFEIEDQIERLRSYQTWIEEIKKQL